MRHLMRKLRASSPHQFSFISNYTPSYPGEKSIYDAINLDLQCVTRKVVL